MTLFYVIKDNPADDKDWLSVGFINGEPVLEGEYGGISVDRANAELTERSLRAALGPDHDEIIEVLTEKNESLGGVHPARAKIGAAAKSLKDLNYLIKSLSKDEAADIIGMVIKEPNISPEVLVFLSSDKDTKVRRVVASNTSTPAKTLNALASDKEISVRMGVVKHPSISAKTLQTLASDLWGEIRKKVASHRLTATETLRTLASDKASEVRKAANDNLATREQGLAEARLRQLIRQIL